MNKMFTTQLTGLFQRLSTEENGFLFEHAARLLAQAPAGEGSIYMFGSGELKAVTAEALYGVEPLQTARELTMDVLEKLTSTDRVWLFSRSTDTEELTKIGSSLSEKDIPFVTVANIGEKADLSDVLIDLKLAKGLLPDEMGNRFGYPTGMAALFIYHHIHFLIKEIMEDEWV